MGFPVFFGFIVFSILTGLLACVFGFILRHKPENKSQDSSCAYDLEDSKEDDFQFQINFPTFPICFLLFEAQCALMFPFAYLKGVLDAFYVMEIMIFILIIIITLIFILKTNFLKLN